MTPDQQPLLERRKQPPFIELRLAGTEPAWCVDGRPDYSSEKGPQMLGASLHPVALYAIYKGVALDESLVEQSFQTLSSNGFVLGAHRGAHQHESNSDCGFADRIPEVIKKAQEQQQEITDRLLRICRENQFSLMINAVFEKIHAFSPDNITLYGEALISKAQREGAKVENLEGDHQERVAFVNLKTNITLDTNRLNQQGSQAFNLDLWMAVKQGETLGVEKDFASSASLILYQATEMVLVEAKGKPPLPVVLNLSL